MNPQNAEPQAKAAETEWYIHAVPVHQNVGYRYTISRDPNGHGWRICSVHNCADAREIAELIASAPTLKAQRDELLAALQRAEHLMDATMRLMRDNPIAAEHVVFYDEAECDGTCLADDCEDALRSAAQAIANATKPQA